MLREKLSTNKTPKIVEDNRPIILGYLEEIDGYIDAIEKELSDSPQRKQKLKTEKMAAEFGALFHSAFIHVECVTLTLVAGCVLINQPMLAEYILWHQLKNLN